jgi:anti-sigma factor RsiW
MNIDAQAHPDAEQLKAYGLGQVAAVEAAEIESHVTGCAVCCQTLCSLPDDQLVALLRQAFHNPPDTERPPSESPTVTLPAPPPLAPELANHPRYRIVALLGSGGMGVVYKAEHRLMERPVALKVIDRGLTGKPEVVERFRREVKQAWMIAA